MICVRGTGSFEQKGSTLSQVLAINHVNLDKLPSEFQFLHLYKKTVRLVSRGMEHMNTESMFYITRNILST